MTKTDPLARIEESVRRFPDRIAYAAGGRSITYRELWRRSGRLANWLVQTVGEDTSPIAVLGHKSIHMIVGFLAANRAGHAYVPIDDGLPDQRILSVLRQARVRVLFDFRAPSPPGASTPDGSAIALADGEDAPLPDLACIVRAGGDIYSDLNQTSTTTSTSRWVVALEEIYAQTWPDVPRQRKIGPNDDAYVIFTSGSTGVPKGARITLGCLESFVSWVAEEHGFRPGREAFLNQAPFSFDLSVMDMYGSLCTGGTLYSLDRSTMADPAALFAWLREMPLTMWVSTPSFAQICLAEKRFDARCMPELRAFLFCGEVLSHATVAQLRRRFPEASVYNLYGPTEATCATASILIDDAILERYDPLPVGRCKSDARIEIVDVEHDPASSTPLARFPDGHVGEIVIIGPNVSPGYLNQRAATSRVFRVTDPDHPHDSRAYRTGDLGHLEDGMLFYHGRVDHQVKLRGYRIELEDIEWNLRRVSGVEDAAAVPITRGDRIECVVAYVTGQPPHGESDSAYTTRVRDELSRLVPDYMLPRRVIHRSTLPLTANGKVDRTRLLADATG